MFQIVKESCEVVEGCHLLKRFLVETRLKYNFMRGRHAVINTFRCFDDFNCSELSKTKIWHTNRTTALLSNGDKFNYVSYTHINIYTAELSSNLLLLAAPYKNIVVIHERKQTGCEFNMLALLALVNSSEVKPDESSVSVKICPHLYYNSIAAFALKYELTDAKVTVDFFTGIDSPDERRVCLHLSPYSEFPYQYILWDIDRNRLVHRWNMNRPSCVIEGWDKRGVCVTHCEDGSSTAKYVKFYDVNWQLLTTIPVKAYIETLVVSSNFSVAVISIEDNKKLVMWEKDSTEYRVLTNKAGELINVGSYTIAYYIYDEPPISIFAAPDWGVATVIRCDLFQYFEFSDGSLFFITGPTHEGYTWFDIDWRVKTDIKDRRNHDVKGCGKFLDMHVMKSLGYTSGATFAVVYGPTPYFFSAMKVRFIDYLKGKDKLNENMDGSTNQPVKKLF